MNRYIVERANKAEIRPEKQSEKAESGCDNLWKEIQLKGQYRQKQTQEQNKKTSGQARLVYVKNINRNTPTTWRWAHGDILLRQLATVPIFKAQIKTDSILGDVSSVVMQLVRLLGMLEMWYVGLTYRLAFL